MKAPLSTVVAVAGWIGSVAGLSAQSNFVYTNDNIIGANTVSGFQVDSSGNLTPVANSPFATGGGGTQGGGFAVNRIVVSGSKYLYATDGGTSDIAGFQADPVAGSLTPVPGSPFAVGGTPAFADISLATSPDGKFLFAGLSSNNSVVSFAVNSDGSLTQTGALGIPAAPDGMKVTPDGKYLAAALPAYLGFGGIAMFAIAADGTLTMINGMPFFGTGAVAGIDVNCASSELFGGVMTQGTTLVDGYHIGSGGALTRMAGSPFSPGTGMNSNVVLLTPNDQWIFASNQMSDSITMFSVDAVGALAVTAGSPFQIGGQAANPSGMATDQAGNFLYVASGPNLIQVFSIGADGTLTPVAGSPFPTAQSGGLLSLAAFPAKTCNGGSGGGVPPPAISGMPGACTIWPPDRRMVQVATVSAAAEAGLVSFSVTGASNEPADPSDIQIAGSGLGPFIVSLRADRLGSGTGRIYTLTAAATDAAGNTTNATATCSVPHDQDK